MEFINSKENKSRKQVYLAEIITNSNFENGFPYTVGYFKRTKDEKSGSSYAYLEIRIIRSIEDFWKFLNDLDV